MRLKDLFTVPEGQKVTEKHLRRVLISSICGILLCMSCLASTTWAWFTVSIENKGNVIQVASVPRVSVTVNTEKFDSGPITVADNVIVNIENSSDLDDVKQKSTLYVTISIDGVVRGVVKLHSGNKYKTSITIKTDASCSLSWTASWVEPPDADQLSGDTITLITEEKTEPVDGATDSTDATASTETTVPMETTIPTETTTPSETTDSTETMESVEATASTESDTTPAGDAAPPESGTP